MEKVLKEILAKLANIEDILEDMRDSDRTLELGAACLLNDRLFGLKRGADAKSQDLCDETTLDMLRNLRDSANKV